MPRSYASEIIEHLANNAKDLTRKYEQMDREITRLFISGHSKSSPAILNLESLKRACKQEISEINSHSVRIKEEIGLISK